MTSVDDLFKRPSLPGGSIKRKFEAPDPHFAYKTAKLSPNSQSNSDDKLQARVEEEADADDVEVGPSLPPEDEDEDDEGRFFGGGVTKDAAQALDYLNDYDGEGELLSEEKIDSAWLKRLAVSFEKKLKKNVELRARYEMEPQKFMASEADLDAEIKSWSLLGEHPELYEEFAGSESAASLVGLLAHENTDIVIGAIEILSELLDEDVEADQRQWDALAAALVDADLLGLLMSNLGRLDEQNESDQSGVYHTLAVMEALASQQALAEQIGRKEVLDWLCRRIQKAEFPVAQNKQYAAEVLQVLLQSSPVLRKRLAIDVDGVDLFLQLLARYRKRDPPKDSPEEEFAENIFDSLTCVVDDAEGKTKFVEAEGVELCLLMLQEGTFSKMRALRLLDHTVGGQGPAAVRACEHLVEAGGLKTLFGMFMKKADSTTVEHLLGIFSVILRLLPGESAARIRTLAKFAEKNYQKTDRLVGLRHDYAKRFRAVDEEVCREQRSIDEEDWPSRADEWFSRRLDGGLFCLRLIDVVIAWVLAEDAGAKERVKSSDDDTVMAIKTSLEEQIADLDPEVESDEDLRDMLRTLVSCLQ